ncbi:MAG: hypothetical protein GY810_06625 [Aureispira sp.]|nr:hypothetical protein [Aureispira sp.]
MKIINLNTDFILTIPYLMAVSGHKKPPVKTLLPVYEGTVDSLPKGIEALVTVSDLQGRIMVDGKDILMGEVVPETLYNFMRSTYPDLNLDKVGVLLCGDLFAHLDQRGGLGDVRKVWQAFNWFFGWVAGVAGNHDSFGTEQEFEEFKKEANIHYLQAEIQSIKGLKIGGMSGVVGKSKKPNRIPEKTYTSQLKRIIEQRPDLILLHQGPNTAWNPYKGSFQIRKMVEQYASSLICFGHEQWPDLLNSLENGTQLLNLEGRVVILTTEK